MITLSRSSITSKPDYVLFLDPSINFTGWACYRLWRAEHQVHTVLHAYGVIEPLGETVEARTVSMVARGIQTFLAAPCTAAVIELPPDTIYGAKVMTKDMIIAKAESVFKTYGVAMALLCGIRTTGKQATTIYPRQWELDHRPRKKLGFKDVKAWSMSVANDVLDRSGFTRETLETRKEQNAADAITMGERILPRLLAGDMPATS